VIIRRIRSRFTPSNAADVRKRFESILRKASNPQVPPVAERKVLPRRQAKSA
jgi:hypothetical protein